MSIAEVPKSREFSGTRTKTPPYSPPTSATQPEFAHLKSLDDLDALNFYCFGGRRSFSDGFRALVVGRGTSQSVIDLAEQLRGTGAVVVYVDESEQAIDIAQDHAKTRGVCDDIEWIQAAPLDLVGIELESFDYINCCGMLERNPEPAAALQLLKSIFKPDGALGLSFQGKYGRTGISQMRDMMSLVNRNMDDAGDAVAMTRAMIDRLPAMNWCKQAVDLFPIYDGLSDTEIHDLFNSQQQSVFSIPDVWDLLDTAGLILVEHTRATGAVRTAVRLSRGAAAEANSEAASPRSTGGHRTVQGSHNTAHFLGVQPTRNSCSADRSRYDSALHPLCSRTQRATVDFGNGRRRMVVDHAAGG